MIRIKNYIFPEENILYIRQKTKDSVIVLRKRPNEYDNFKTELEIKATFDDIEWNYGQSNIKDDEYIELSNKYQRLIDRVEELKEENQKLKKDLEIEINNSNIKSAQIKTKDTIIKKLQSAKDKTINYVNKKLNADEPILVEYEIETIIELLEGE